MKKNKYFLTAIILENCPYSISAANTLKNYNIPHKLIHVDNEKKDIYKSAIINTYPQIYLNKLNSKGNLLLGGYDDLMSFINNFRHQNLDNIKINNFMKNYKWSEKPTKRLIELINQK